MNLSFILVATLILAGNAAAQQVSTVIGTGDPTVDVPAVQAAVDQGGRVILRGHFSFDAPPTVLEKSAGAGIGTAGVVFGTILVSKAVVISGTQDDQGEVASIEGGTNPFYVEAPGAHVEIQKLHFIRPKIFAIRVEAAAGVVIAFNRIEGLVVDAGSALAIAISTSAGPPGSSNPGQPANISGTLLIANNDIDMQAAEGTNFSAIVVFAVGQSPDKEVDLYISGNKLSNGTGRMINVWSVGGRADIERNVITTTATPGSNVAPSGDVIHINGPGSYVVAHNTIDCAWTSGRQAAIRLQTNAGQPVLQAIVADNELNMSAPADTMFTATSAAIEIRGAGSGNMVLNNRIRGQANFALSVVNQSGTPGNTALIMNDLSGFTSAQADVFVDAGGTNTIAVGAQRTVEDHGSGTVIVPMR